MWCKSIVVILIVNIVYGEDSLDFTDDVFLPITEPVLIPEDSLIPIGNDTDGDTEIVDSPPLAVRSNAYQMDNTISGPDLPISQDAVGLSERQLLDTGTGTGTGTTFNTGNYDYIDGRILPSTLYNNNGQPYVVTATRLAQIRANFLYWFYDQGGDENIGDYQKDIHTSSPQIHKNFNFQLPFFGFRFNYTRVSVNGYLTFSDAPDHYTYPLSFPIKDWPQVADPSFIGIFFSKCRIGSMRPEETDPRKPGVYFRMDRDLQGRTDQLGVEMRERVMWDIREGVIGANSFVPKHAVTITWKNMSFAGGIDNSLYKTNTFQMVLATDEVFAYAIFNYVEISWSSHTESGGDTTGGEGGVPAYIGFNAGNGTRSYEYKPYSQESVLRDLTSRGWANGFPGRHIFRIDEKILLGTCNKDIDGANLPLMFAPESGNMLGGTVVNITGPCFELTDRVTCRFDTEAVNGVVVDRNRAVCIQPRFYHNGYARLEVAINNFDFKWKGKFFVETPATAAEKIFFEDNSVHERYPNEIKISWDGYNLTSNFDANLRISIWGYKETTIRPRLEYIDMIAENVANVGTYTITPQTFRNRRNPLHIDMEFGFIQINLTSPIEQGGVTISPMLWSRPIPLAWYFAPQYEEVYNTQRWEVPLCNKWLKDDRFLKNFAAEVPQCPCTMAHALLDKGRFLPDVLCNKDTNPTCKYNWGAIHCVKSGSPSAEGSGQQCCYDKNGLLMLSYDQQWGAGPYRSHDFGFLPYNEANKVPSLSNWFHDMLPFYKCCLWQEEQAVGCETFRFERRPSQDCVAYQAPGVAGIFGDPHIITFDNVPYTFNGKGEYVLTRVDHSLLKLDVQGRFEQVPKNYYGEVNATYLTSVAMSSNKSAVIEVRLRPTYAQWRYRLDVFADGQRVYFDRPALRIQNFPGVTVYMPPYILNQSEIVVMFSSGAGVEVVENKGFMTARVYLPWTYINQTRGLFGNWSFDMNDDFTRPDGTIANLDLNDFRSAHQDFAQYWQLTDREQTGIGAALFVREFGRTAAYYSDSSFIQNYIAEPVSFLPANRSHDVQRANELCDNSYQCRYDYGMTLNRDMAEFTKNYYTSVINIKETNDKRVISCGILETPRFGRKSNFFFTPGTKVTFECNQNFILTGDRKRTCEDNGKWNLPEYGYTECLRQQEYSQRTLLITGAIVVAIFLPLLLFLCLFYFWCIHKPREEGRPTWNFEDYPRSKSLSRLNLRTASMGNLTEPMKTADEKQKLVDVEPVTPTQTLVTRAAPAPPISSEPQDEDSSGLGYTDSSKSDKSDLRKRRLYDKTYRTNEPLPNAPDVDFPEKLWDLSEEDILSLTSGSDSNKDSTLTKPAKDIEYINKPKQLGRRALVPASDSGYSTSVKASEPLAAEPEDQGSPISSHYSPTYSEIYTPPISPTSDQGSSPRRGPSPKSEPSSPIKTYAMPVSPGRSRETLIDPPDPNVLGNQEYSQRTLGVTWAVIGAVMVPLVIILICLGFRMIERKKREDKEELMMMGGDESVKIHSEIDSSIPYKKDSTQNTPSPTPAEQVQVADLQADTLPADYLQADTATRSYETKQPTSWGGETEIN